MTIEDKVIRMLTGIVDDLMMDAYTVTPPLTRKQAVQMCPDYVDIHGRDKDAVNLWAGMSRGQQDRILRKVK